MKFKTLFFVTAFILLFNNIYPQTDTSKKNLFGWRPFGWRHLGNIYIYTKFVWSDKQVPFHFDEGVDMYMQNVDKAGHFLGACGRYFYIFNILV